MTGVRNWGLREVIEIHVIVSAISWMKKTKQNQHFDLLQPPRFVWNIFRNGLSDQKIDKAFNVLPWTVKARESLLEPVECIANLEVVAQLQQHGDEVIHPEHLEEDRDTRL